MSQERTENEYVSGRGPRKTGEEADGMESESSLSVLPVDPHRIFATWRLTPALLHKAQIRQPPAAPSSFHTNLVLRVFRLREHSDTLDRAFTKEDFPLAGSREDTYFSLAFPGGFVVAVLGTRDSRGRFFPLLTAPRIALPEAPASESSLQAPIREQPPSKSATDDSAPHALDEAAVLQGLPEELRQLPPGRTAQKPEDPFPAAAVPGKKHITETFAFDERHVVAAALSPFRLSTGKHGPQQPGEHSPAPQPALPGIAPRDNPSSFRIGSAGVREGGGAPLGLRATVVIEGRLPPGQCIHIDGAEIAPRMENGRFVWTRPVRAFFDAWRLLAAHAVPPTKERRGFSPQSPETAPPWLFRCLVEIEGFVRDPAYLHRLPRGIFPDAAGRFRLIRPLPPGHPELPQITLSPPRASG